MHSGDGNNSWKCIKDILLRHASHFIKSLVQTNFLTDDEKLNSNISRLRIQQSNASKYLTHFQQNFNPHGKPFSSCAPRGFTPFWEQLPPASSLLLFCRASTIPTAVSHSFKILFDHSLASANWALYSLSFISNRPEYRHYLFKYPFFPLPSSHYALLSIIICIKSFQSFVQSRWRPECWKFLP